jgi:hypothetical protein
MAYRAPILDGGKRGRNCILKILGLNCSFVVYHMIAAAWKSQLMCQVNFTLVGEVELFVDFNLETQFLPSIPSNNVHSSNYSLLFS